METSTRTRPGSGPLARSDPAGPAVGEISRDGQKGAGGEQALSLAECLAPVHMAPVHTVHSTETSIDTETVRWPTLSRSSCGVALELSRSGQEETRRDRRWLAA